MNWGATAADWLHFDLILGLTTELLPVVSNPHAVVSPHSNILTPGKVPSEYNKQRQLRGFVQWTKYYSTPDDIARWSAETDLGICLQTRIVRAIDVDVTDEGLAREIDASIPAHLPRRRRSNSTKFLAAFTFRGDLSKRRIITAHGAIELLATGQQFVAVGTHPSGSRYVWDGGLPDSFPEWNPDDLAPAG